MNAIQAIKLSIDMSTMICNNYLTDLNDSELMHRPAPGCNHINWQLGHLISVEHDLVEKVAPGSMAPLPAGFVEKYTKETAANDDAARFCNKAELMKVLAEQRKGALSVLDKTSESDLDKPSGMDWAPNVGSVLSAAIGGHWMMHCGQWAVVRRQLGRAPLM